MDVYKSGAAQSAALLTLFVTVFAQDQVLLLPSPIQVAYVGGPARIECITGFAVRTTSRIQWFINETLTISSLDNVTEDVAHGETNAIRGSLLKFAAVPVEYNMTRVHCHVEFTTGDPITSTTTVLLVQGLLDATHPMIDVSEDFSIFLNWTAPFTLLGASEITYCVDVVHLTTRRALQSECGINITQFTYTAMPRDFVCGELSFTVTPVNIVGNGTSATVELTNLSSNPLLPPQLVNLTEKTMSTGFLLLMSAPVCYIELRFMDVDTGEIITLEDTDVTISETNITFSTQQLRENRGYNVTITASNAAGSATSRTTLTIERIFIVNSRAIEETDSEEISNPTTIVLDTDVHHSSCHSNSYTSLLVTTVIIIATLSGQ